MERDPDPGDRLALRSLVDAYATTADTRDYDAFVGLFTPDGSIVIAQDAGEPMVFAGADLRAAATPLDQYHATMHLVANHECAVDGDTATGMTYCQANHLRDAADGVENLRMTIRYDDAYARTDGGWRFARRDLQILWTEVVPASTGRLEL